VVTFEFESVPAETVPSSRIIVNRLFPNAEFELRHRPRSLVRKSPLFPEPGIPTPEFADIQSQDNLDCGGPSYWPACVMKTSYAG